MSSTYENSVLATVLLVYQRLQYSKNHADALSHYWDIAKMDFAATYMCTKGLAE